MPKCHAASSFLYESYAVSRHSVKISILAGLTVMVLRPELEDHKSKFSYWPSRQGQVASLLTPRHWQRRRNIVMSVKAHKSWGRGPLGGAGGPGAPAQPSGVALAVDPSPGCQRGGKPRPASHTGRLAVRPARPVY